MSKLDESQFPFADVACWECGVAIRIAVAFCFLISCCLYCYSFVCSSGLLSSPVVWVALVGVF